MTPEQKLLLTCFADHIQGRRTNAPSSLLTSINDENRSKEGNKCIEDNCYLDFAVLEHLTLQHNAGGMLYYQCKEWIKDVPSIHKSFLDSIFLSVNRADILKEIVTRFKEENIDIICMKGTIFRDCYPVPELRSMGDIDFIIHTRDREKADHILRSDMGFSRFIDNQAVWTYCLGYFMIEVHDHMFYEYLANAIDYRGYFDHVWEHCHSGVVFGIKADNLYVPDESFHFLYLMVHTAKHIINNGAGFRAFLDMVFVLKKQNLNMEWIKQELKTLQLYDFTRTCFALCERWFGVCMPFGEKYLDEQFFEEITEKTFADGIFGLDNLQNEGAHSAKEIKRDDRGYLQGALLLTLHKVFPAYDDMQLIPWYSWVDGRPWLLPAAWVYRWFYCLRKKAGHSINLLLEPFARRDIVEKRKELIKSWGL